MSGTCKNNDRYDISRNDCAIYPSASEYMKRLKNLHNTVSFGNKYKFQNNTERLQHITQLMHSRRFIVKGNPLTTYKKTAILTTGRMNECDQFIQSEFEQVRRAQYYVRRRYKDTEVV